LIRVVEASGQLSGGHFARRGEGETPSRPPARWRRYDEARPIASNFFGLGRVAQRVADSFQPLAEHLGVYAHADTKVVG